MRRIDKYDLNTVEGICTLVQDIDKLLQANYKVLDISEYLLSEVHMRKVKRWELYNGDLKKADKEFAGFCKENKCVSCRLCAKLTHTCFTNWLMEEVEVEECEE